MTLQDLIDRLEQEDPDKVVPIGFHNPHSYRGIYHELAFEPKRAVTVGENTYIALPSYASPPNHPSPDL